MVEWQIGTTSLSIEGSLVFNSKPSTTAKEIPAEVASPNPCSPGSVPQPIIQDGVYQTRGSCRSTLQSQKGHR
jgi:hypothetical protein